MTSVINEITEKVEKGNNEDIKKEIMKSSVSLRIMISRLENMAKGNKPVNNE